jgi:hypothetical protein
VPVVPETFFSVSPTTGMTLEVTVLPQRGGAARASSGETSKGITLRGISLIFLAPS